MIEQGYQVYLSTPCVNKFSPLGCRGNCLTSTCPGCGPYSCLMPCSPAAYTTRSQVSEILGRNTSFRPEYNYTGYWGLECRCIGKVRPSYCHTAKLGLTLEIPQHMPRRDMAHCPNELIHVSLWQQSHQQPPMSREKRTPDTPKRQLHVFERLQQATASTSAV